MKKSNLILNSIAIALVSLNAQAGLKNIATLNLESRDRSAAACTILETGGPYYNGGKVLAVFSESNEENSDPRILVQDLAGRSNWENDDWLGQRTLNGSVLGGTTQGLIDIYRAGLGRTPGRSSDAAILVTFPPGTAVCAFSREYTTTNLKSVSMSITDITPLFTQSSNNDGPDMLKKLLSTD